MQGWGSLVAIVFKHSSDKRDPLVSRMLGSVEEFVSFFVCINNKLTSAVYSLTDYFQILPIIDA